MHHLPSVKHKHNKKKNLKTKYHRRKAKRESLRRKVHSARHGSSHPVISQEEKPKKFRKGACDYYQEKILKKTKKCHQHTHPEEVKACLQNLLVDTHMWKRKVPKSCKLYNRHLEKHHEQINKQDKKKFSYKTPKEKKRDRRRYGF